MNYYYNELANIPNDPNIQIIRNQTLESQIALLIFSKISSVVAYLDQQKDKTISRNLKDRFDHILDTAFKSPILNEQWKLYKDNYSDELTRNYLNQKFEINQKYTEIKELKKIFIY